MAENEPSAQKDPFESPNQVWRDQRINVQKIRTKAKSILRRLAGHGFPMIGVITTHRPVSNSSGIKQGRLMGFRAYRRLLTKLNDRVVDGALKKSEGTLHVLPKDHEVIW